MKSNYLRPIIFVLCGLGYLPLHSADVKLSDLPLEYQKKIVIQKVIAKKPKAPKRSEADLIFSGHL